MYHVQVKPLAQMKFSLIETPSADQKLAVFSIGTKQLLLTELTCAKKWKVFPKKSA
jgi:hypothetical protein